MTADGRPAIEVAVRIVPAGQLALTGSAPAYVLALAGAVEGADRINGLIAVTLAAICLDGEDVAGLHAPAVEVDGARSAVGGVAPHHRAGLAEGLAQVVHEQHPGFDVVRHAGAVDDKLDIGHGALLISITTV